MLSRVLPDNYLCFTIAAKQMTKEKNWSLVIKNNVVKERKKFKNYEEEIWQLYLSILLFKN